VPAVGTGVTLEWAITKTPMARQTRRDRREYGGAAGAMAGRLHPSGV